MYGKLGGARRGHGCANSKDSFLSTLFTFLLGPFGYQGNGYRRLRSGKQIGMQYSERDRCHTMDGHAAYRGARVNGGHVAFTSVGFVGSIGGQREGR